MHHRNQIAGLVFLLSGVIPAHGGEWTKEPGVRVSGGNVPFVYQLEGGGYRLYFCGQGGILSAKSADGLNFTAEPGVRTPGCDPSLVKLDDGRYRMYYKLASGPGGPGQSVHRSYSAISNDGLNFVSEGLRLESVGTIDNGWVSVPEVVRTFDGRWRMYYVSARDSIANVIASAVSEDGLHFVREEGVRVQGMVDPAVVALPNGQYWLFGMVGLGAQGAQVIRSATSADGLRFVMDSDVVARAGGPDDRNGLFDPSVVGLPDGRYRVYYGGDSGKTLSATGSRTANPGVGSGVAVSAADPRRSVLAPGSIASLYGEQMTTQTAGTNVEVNGLQAAVFYASATQINFAIPEGVAGTAAHIVVTAPEGRQTAGLAPVREVSPALFTLANSGAGEAAALDAVDFSPGPFHVASGARYVSLFGTGIRRARRVTVTLGGLPVEVLYAGPQQQHEGLDQINIRIPPGYPLRGPLALEVGADGEPAGAGVTLTVVD